MKNKNHKEIKERIVKNQDKVKNKMIRANYLAILLQVKVVRNNPII
jgi:hypothetical protein